MDAGSRRISTTRTVAEGRYLIRNLPPGDYLLAVVGDFEQGAQTNPEFLRGLGARPVRVPDHTKGARPCRICACGSLNANWV